MRLIIILGLIVMSLTSCHNTAADVTRELDKLYPKAEIYRVTSDIYIMFDSTGVYCLANQGFMRPKFSRTLIKKY